MPLSPLLIFSLSHAPSFLFLLPLYLTISRATEMISISHTSSPLPRARTLTHKGEDEDEIPPLSLLSTPTFSLFYVSLLHVFSCLTSLLLRAHENCFSLFSSPPPISCMRWREVLSLSPTPLSFAHKRGREFTLSLFPSDSRSLARERMEKRGRAPSPHSLS